MERERTHGVKETCLLVSLESVSSSVGKFSVESVPVEERSFLEWSVRSKIDTEIAYEHFQLQANRACTKITDCWIQPPIFTLHLWLGNQHNFDVYVWQYCCWCCQKLFKVDNDYSIDKATIDVDRPYYHLYTVLCSIT